MDKFIEDSSIYIHTSIIQITLCKSSRRKTHKYLRDSQFRNPEKALAPYFN